MKYKVWNSLSILALGFWIVSLFVGSFVAATPKGGFMETWTGMVSLLALFGGAISTVVAIFAFFEGNYGSKAQD